MARLFGDEKESAHNVQPRSRIPVRSLAVVTLAVIGAAVRSVPWLRDTATDISLSLLMLLLIASGFTAALGLIAPYIDRSTSAVTARTPMTPTLRRWRRPRRRDGLPAIR